MENQHLALLQTYRCASPIDAVPSREELTRHLAARWAVHGDTAFAEFAYLHKIAAETWGGEATSHFARILRDARVAPKPQDGCPWMHAERQVGTLPSEWQPGLVEQIAISRKGRAVLGRTIWSVDYTEAVLGALRRWSAHCTAKRQSLRPTAASLHCYACDLVLPDLDAGTPPVTIGTAANYLQRINAGLLVATAGKFHSASCDFVVSNLRETAKDAPSKTKTGNQLVGASALYRLGFNLIEGARNRPLRGVRAATEFRNGLIFAVGAALPERARALTWLEFDRTLTLIGETCIHVQLPGEALKYPEAQKASEGYDVIFENPGLAAVLHEYRAMYRPIFDDGNHLFPSVHGKPGAIKSKQLGRLTGDITKLNFDVRIPIHRLRDNVATEAAENLIGGVYGTKTLLRHVDERTTRRHYDRSEGIKTATEYDNFIEERRTVRVELIL